MGIVFDAFQAFLSASNNLIEQNIVAHNGGGGIVIEPSVEGNNLGNALVQNSIYSNGGLGIDLNDDGPTADDPGDSDTGANSRQNFPVLSSVEVSGGNLLVKGSLNSLANATFRISFFASPAIDASGFGEGQTAVGSIDVTSNDSGNATIQFWSTDLRHGQVHYIHCDALVNGSPRDTSEFSAAVSLWMVTNTLDSGPGSLRGDQFCQCLAKRRSRRDSWGRAGCDYVCDPGGGVKTISVATALPAITEAVIIDGYSQVGASPNTNAIDDPDPAKRGLNGTLLIELTQQADSTLGIDGLSITADDCTIRGLVINRFSAGSGIRISGDNNVITGNYIGTNSAGTFAAANGGRGIFLVDAAQQNRIGTNADGIGDAAERNLLSGNVLDGVTIFGEGVAFNVVAGNLIGTNFAGTAAIANQVNGVGIFTGASFNTIGGHAPAARNVLSGNTLSGVVMADPNTMGNVVAGNYIGTNVAGVGAVAKRGTESSSGAALPITALARMRTESSICWSEMSFRGMRAPGCAFWTPRLRRHCCRELHWHG